MKPYPAHSFKLFVLYLDKVDDVSSSVYERIQVGVNLKVVEGHFKHNNVEVYTVSSQYKQPRDIPPSLDYISNMIEGASLNKLPDDYIDFLRWLKRRIKESHVQDDFLVFSTNLRKGAKGLGLIKVSNSVVKNLKLHNLAAVFYENKVCLAQVVPLKSLDNNSCELDQSVRHMIGILGRETYGSHVSIFPVSGDRFNFPLVKPRTLMLKVFPPVWLDSEKNICILHENNIRLLGLIEGEYVRISTVRPNKSSQYQIQEITLRVFSGCSSEILIDNSREEYPDIRKIYLDKDGRAKLGIEEDVPIVVSADTWKLFTGRLSYYGITLFLGITALAPIVKEVFGLSSTVSFGLTLLFSAMITLLLSVFDLRGKVQY